MEHAPSSAAVLDPATLVGPVPAETAAPRPTPPAAETSSEAEPAPPPGRPRWDLPFRPVWLGIIVFEMILLVVAPWILVRWVYVNHVYNFHAVVPDVGQPARRPEVVRLFRCGQMSADGLEAAIRAHGIKTVVNLQWGREDPPAGGSDGRTEKDACDRAGARYLFMPVADIVEAETVRVPRPDGRDMIVPWPVAEFLKIMDEVEKDPSKGPVLIHCRVGKHRTGVLSAVYRMEYDRWDPERTMKEMDACGFGGITVQPKFWRERAFVQTYQPRWRDSMYPIGKWPPMPVFDRTRSRDGRDDPGPADARPQGTFSGELPAGVERSDKD
jgi:protein tyrosine phosphatase (PTP) superfamily phosphohydrolase (DUF442 family)